MFFYPAIGGGQRTEFVLTLQNLRDKISELQNPTENTKTGGIMFFKKKKPVKLVPGWRLDARTGNEENGQKPDRYFIPDQHVLEVNNTPGQEFIRFRVPSGSVTWDGQTTICEIESGNILHLERSKDTGYKFTRDECAITTAVTTQTGTRDEALLDRFRQYRHQWLESNRGGKFLSELYSQWGPPIAKWLQTAPRFSSFIRRTFINPCESLLRWSDRKSGIVATFAKVLVMCWYAAGTCTAKLAYEVRR